MYLPKTNLEVSQMSLFKKNENQASSRKRVVVTGKRVRGAWTMESVLPPGERRDPSGRSSDGRNNRRVRTLH